MRTPVSSFALLVLSTVACAAPTAPPQDHDDLPSGRTVELGRVLFNSCGNAASVPLLKGTTFAHPQALDVAGNPPPNWNPSDGRYAAGNVQYVAGNSVRLELATDGCTNIQQVKIGQTILTPTFTNGYWYSVADESSSPTGHIMSLSMFYPGAGDGSSDDVTVTVGRVGGVGTTSYSFPLVRVKTV